jgi:hypothetical protein
MLRERPLAEGSNTLLSNMFCHLTLQEIPYFHNFHRELVFIHGGGLKFIFSHVLRAYSSFGEGPL